MAGEETVGLVTTSAQKSIEITAELIKMLAPLVPKLLKGALSATKAIEEKVSEHSLNAVGNVGLKNLIGIANESGSMIQSNGNILSEDANKFTEKAKKYGIPISVVGDGEKVTVDYLERDTSIIKQIESEILAERMQERPQEFKQFKISEENISAMKSEFEKNGVECQFISGANGKIYCTYPAKDTEKVDLIKQDFKSACDRISHDFKAYPENGKLIIEDAKHQEAIEFSDRLTQSNVQKFCMEQFGYSETEANLAARKLYDDIVPVQNKLMMEKLTAEKYLADTNQLDSVKALKTNIRYESDSILLRDVEFSAVNFNGEHTHISIMNGDKSIGLTPAEMTREEMKNICVTELGMGVEQANEAVEKAVKIDAQINSKLHETTIFRDNGVQQTAEIDRMSRNSFSVRLGTTMRDYNFNEEHLAAKIGKDFGITENKAQSIISKAKHQSVILNRVEKTAKSAKKKAEDLSKNLKENLGKHKGAR